MRSRTLAVSLVMIFLAACGGGGGGTTTTTLPETTTTNAPAEQTTTTRSEAAIQIEAPAQIVSGADFSVSWTGPNNERDYITLVPVGTPDGEYRAYFYTSNGPVGNMTAPADLGSYELRYMDGATDKTLHSIQIEVIANQVTLVFPAEVSAGSVFEVTWTGPDGSRDFVTVVPQGAPEGTYQDYFYTNAGPTGSLVAPPDAGTYEVRYVGGSSNATFHSQSITVTPFDITLQAPAEVDKGTEFEVTWAGPNGPGDYVTIVLVGAAPGSYGDWAYVTEGNPVKLTAPNAPGDYELRYQADRVQNRVFHSIPIKVR